MKKKIKRKGKRAEYSKKFLQRVKLRDFLGKLTPDEVVIAKETGNLRWDLYRKAGQVAVLTGDLHRQGFRLAPVFDGHGNPEPGRYPDDVKFIISNYEDLEKVTNDSLAGA